MANLFARAAANWVSANWNTQADGGGAGATPGASDVCMANGFDITVNTNVTVSEVRNDTTGGATGGGRFILSNGVTLTANVFAGGTAPTGNGCVQYVGTTGNSATIVGTVTGGSVANSHGAILTGTAGTLHVTGNVTGGSANPSYGVGNNGSNNATVSITGNATGGSSTGSVGAYNLSGGTLNLTGNALGGAGAPGCIAVGGTVNITGNCIAHATAGNAGFSSTGTGYTLTVTGYAQANDFGSGSAGITSAPGISITHQGTATIGETRAGARGLTAVNGAFRYASTTTAKSTIRATSGLTELVLRPIAAVVPATTDVKNGVVYGDGGYTGTLTMTSDYPAQSNVRTGIGYDFGEKTGTCHVPTANQVAYGVPVDNTTGTALLTAAAIRAELATELSRIDATISSRSTLTAGDIPAGLSASDIADAVRTEIAPELATIEAINDRIELQVPDGPVLVVPAPSAGQTTAWTMCYDEHGEPEANVPITVRLYGTGTAATSAWDAAATIVNSSAEGLASLSLPRNAGLRFQVRRGTGPWVKFSGVDAETLELPAILG